MRNYLYIAIPILLGIPSPTRYQQVLANTKHNRYSQMIFTFPNIRKFTYSYDTSENSLVLEIDNTSPYELESIDQYDESLIRRIILKDLAGTGTELRMFLKDDEVRATITKFKEPFRIIIDLFDRYYEEKRDQTTGYPGAQSSESNISSRIPPLGHTTRTNRYDKSYSGSTNTTSLKSRKGNRRLLQPVPTNIKRPEQMITALNRVPPGLGKNWKEYPLYIYRIHTEIYKTDKNYISWLTKNTNKALTSAQSMAEYGGKLFDFGHEGRALLAYQQVIHKAPNIFDRNPLHLWKLAETHTGQGNLTLAEGYYQSLIEKHPDSALVDFARLRILDVKAIRFLRKGDQDKLIKLSKDLAMINPKSNHELTGQIQIRAAYWSPFNKKDFSKVLQDKYYLPTLETNNRLALENVSPNIEGQRTGFLISALVLNDLLEEKHPWGKQTATSLGNFFNRYKGSAAEPFRSHLLVKSQKVLHKTIQQLASKGEYLKAIKTFEELPKSLKGVNKTPKTSWAIGESYRIVGNSESSIKYYKVAASKSKLPPDRFRANFWLAIATGETLQAEKMKNNNQAKIARLQNSISQADRKMKSSWDITKQKDKDLLTISLKKHFEDTINGPTYLSFPPKIVLSAWDKTLSSETSASSEPSTDWQRNYSPSANTVQLLSDLAKRFAVLGLNREKRKSLDLLKKLKPSQFKGDKQATKLWAKELVSLAEEYRQSNQYSNAGKTYTLVGEQSEDWEGRAEALYKGGLLLYRAGRRQEALDAFTKASEDGNNLLYAELAKKRLDQLQK